LRGGWEGGERGGEVDGVVVVVMVVVVVVVWLWLWLWMDSSLISSRHSGCVQGGSASQPKWAGQGERRIVQASTTSTARDDRVDCYELQEGGCLKLTLKTGICQSTLHRAARSVVAGAASQAISCIRGHTDTGTCILVG
jgi:hypothetical protein